MPSDEKLDLILERIRETKDSVDGLRADMTAVQVSNGQQDVRIGNLDERLGSVHSKLSTHIDGHWAWLGGLVAAFGGFIALAKWLAEK